MAIVPTLNPIETLPTALKTSLSDARSLQAINEAKLDRLMPALRIVAGLAPDRVPLSPTNERNDQTNDFRPQLVDVLLPQVSQILVGLLSAQRNYRTLILQQLNLAVDVLELEKLKQINDDEDAAQIYNVPFWDAQAAVDANQATLNGATETATFLTNEQSTQQLNAAWAAENAEIPFATNSTGGSIGIHQSKLLKSPPAPNGDETTPFGNTIPTSGSTLGALFAYRTVNYSFRYALQQQGSQIAPFNALSPYYAARTSYLAAEASFRERRRDAAFDKLIFKLSKISQSNGPADFASQTSTLLRRAHDDSVNAYARLEAIRDGMKVVYGHVCDALPAAPEDHLDFNAHYLDILVDWTRRVALTLNRLTSEDQSHVYRVSLKEAVGGEDAFKSFRDGKSWKFKLSSQAFAGMKLLRLRGISLSMKGEIRSYPSFVVAAPRLATAIYNSGSPEGTNINQALPDCPVGRPLKLSEKACARMDICGASVLFNGSPIGDWEIRAYDGSTVNEIEDLVFDIYLVVQLGH